MWDRGRPVRAGSDESGPPVIRPKFGLYMRGTDQPGRITPVFRACLSQFFYFYQPVTEPFVPA